MTESPVCLWTNNSKIESGVLNFATCIQYLTFPYQSCRTSTLAQLKLKRHMHMMILIHDWLLIISTTAKPIRSWKLYSILSHPYFNNATSNTRLVLFLYSIFVSTFNAKLQSYVSLLRKCYGLLDYVFVIKL